MKPWAQVAFWIVVVGQLVFLLAFIGYKEADLRDGTDVILQTAPVDPRSLLQGDYAILDYEIATLPQRDYAPTGDYVYVGLRQGKEVWEVKYYRDTVPIAFGGVHQGPGRPAGPPRLRHRDLLRAGGQRPRH